MIIAWQEFDVGDGASKPEVKSAGRAASRAAFVRAAQLWSARHGTAAWAIGNCAAIVHDPEGAPLIDAPDAPAISLTHGRGLAGCAIAAPGQAFVGIDAELTHAPGMRAVRELAARTGEHALPWPDNDWPARLWCAKEAVVKAERQSADLLGRTLVAVGLAAEAFAGDTTFELCPALVRGAAGFAPEQRAGLERRAALDVHIRSHLGRMFIVRTERVCVRGGTSVGAPDYTVAAVVVEGPSA